MSATTMRRHFALCHRLSTAEAVQPATAAWVVARIHRYAGVAGVAPVVATTSGPEYQAFSGRPVGPDMWGEANWACGGCPVVYVDPAKARTRGAAELVVAHEVAHVRWRSYGHRRVLFDRCQALIDQVAEKDASEPAKLY